MLENDGNGALTTIREVCSISLRPLSCSKIPAVALRSEVMHSLAALCPLSLCPHRPPLSSSLSRSQPSWLSQARVRSRLLEQLLSLPITLLLQISEKVHCFLESYLWCSGIPLGPLPLNSLNSHSFWLFSVHSPVFCQHLSDYSNTISSLILNNLCSSQECQLHWEWGIHLPNLLLCPWLLE